MLCPGVISTKLRNTLYKQKTELKTEKQWVDIENIFHETSLTNVYIRNQSPEVQTLKNKYFGRLNSTLNFCFSKEVLTFKVFSFSQKKL